MENMNINARDVHCKTHIISSSHREPEGSRASVSYRLYAYVHFLSVFIVERRASVSVAIFFVGIQGKACIQILKAVVADITKVFLRRLPKSNCLTYAKAERVGDMWMTTGV